MIDRFSCADDAKRAGRSLQKLARHDISRWALAGGFAVEIHCLQEGLPSSTRSLNDIDFVAPSFDCVPDTLARDFLCRHVHPFDPPGKTILQLVDAENTLRIDLFRAYGATMTRTLFLGSTFPSIQLISREDVVARAARLLLDLREGMPVPAKYANDYLRLADSVQFCAEAAWQDHRKPHHPSGFQEADALVRGLNAKHRDRLVAPVYSKDATETCPRCVASAEFPLADPHLVRSLLGYC